ncbi:MAG: methylated-DNA--[protein]-cysteine S-methyltransferase [Bacteroidota bacterium]
MDKRDTLNYQRIEKAIEYIQTHFKAQPSLEEVAEVVHLSAAHFQKLFADWAGVSPKKFLQYTSIEYAKQLLRHTPANLFDTAMETGLSGTGRLHDLFVNIEGMTPGEYKDKGAALTIHFYFYESPFGHLLVASTAKGICYMVFADDEVKASHGLFNQFPKAHFIQQSVALHHEVVKAFAVKEALPGKIKLHLKGTAFQLKVWEALLKIPTGQLTTYGQIADTINSPKASRAVGTAIGSNPIAFVIPCHRVIQASGAIGGYMWGPVRKTAIIGWEAAQVERLLK